jgi:hypothetical protein
MSDYKKEAKSVSAARMQRMGLKLADGSKSFDDMNGGSPFEGLNSGHAGKWPVSLSKFKRGGKVAHMKGEKARKNLGKTPRKAAGGMTTSPVPLPPPRPKNMDKIPLPPRRAPDEEYSAYNPNEPNDLGSRSTEARGGNVSRKQAAAIAYKKRGSGMSSKMGIPKMAGLPNLAADTYVPHKRGGMAKHPDEAQDRKLVKQMVKPNALRAHKNVGGPLDPDDNEPWAYTIVDSSGRNTMPGTGSWAEKKAKPVSLSSGKKMTPDDPWYNYQPSVNGNKKGGRVHKNVGGSADDNDSHENWMKRREEIGREVAAKKAANPGKSFSQIMLDEVGNLGRQHGEYLKSRRANPMSPERQQAMAEGRDDGPSMVDMYGKNQKSGKFAHGGRAHKLSGGALRDYMEKAREDIGAQSNWKNRQRSSNLQSMLAGNVHRPYSPRDIMDTEDRINRRAKGIRMANSKLMGTANVPATEDEDGMMNRGGRAHRATGGRTKGKTNVNIIISPQSGGQGQGVLGAGVGMGQPPVPPMMPPAPLQMPPMPQGGMPPAGGAGGGLPPQLMAALAARGGVGAPPMARKTGGRVGQKMPKYQEKDYGSGSGLGRLEKRKWPVADGTE